MSKSGGNTQHIAEPILLAFETAGARCSAAVARGNTILAGKSVALRHGHGEVLMPMVDRVMAEAALSPQDLAIVAAAIGPGGFTGIRVGLAAARGIGIASNARLIGVTGFAAVAQALRRSPLAADSLLVVLDSRREDLYVQLFALDSAAPLATAQAVLPHHLVDYVRAHPVGASLLIAGDAAETAAVALQGHLDFDVVPDSPPEALGVAVAALEQARSVPADEPMRPLYLRPPDVTLPKPREAGVTTRP